MNLLLWGHKQKMTRSSEELDVGAAFLKQPSTAVVSEATETLTLI